MTGKLAVLGAIGAVSLPAAEWQARAPLPTPRAEVAATQFRGGVAIVGGFVGTSGSKVVEVYNPATNRWRRLPDLPIAVHHPMAAAADGRLYVAGGYLGGGAGPTGAAFAYDGTRWRRLRAMPSPRAAGAAAVAAGRLYVVGGVGPQGLARSGLVLDLKTRRWSSIPGPRPREHLAAAGAGGRVYVLAGRLGGLDSNLDTFQVYSPLSKRWRTLAPVPERRGGTGLAFAAGLLVSVGGEEPDRTIASVYAYDLRRGSWRRLPDMRTPRHGLGVVGVGDKVYAIGGAPVPGLGAHSANEVLDVG
jgi:N-acetylneuraminic acid mutarotase